MNRINLWRVIPGCAGLVAAGAVLGAGITVAVQRHRRPGRWQA